MKTHPIENMPAIYLPNPPAPPEGMKWVYRGQGWTSREKVIFALYDPILDENSDKWKCKDHPGYPVGSTHVHYIEAVEIDLLQEWKAVEDYVLNSSPAPLGTYVGTSVAEQVLNRLKEIDAESDWKSLAEFAAGHLRDMLDDAPCSHSSAQSFLEDRFPEVITPEFDWDTLWSQLPPWIKYVSMDRGGSWYGYSHKPEIEDNSQMLSGSWAVDESIIGVHTIRVPKEYSPTGKWEWNETLATRP